MVKLRNPFCVSGALMKEIFKMYWYIPFITFVLYFFTGIIPILSNISNIESIDYYIYESIKNTNIIYTSIMCATPVITAVLMMGFIHKESKAMMLHALPLSRNRIFNSYYISGWLMCVLPLILMVIPYMLLALKIDVLARVDVLLWLLSSVAVMTWFYGITVFTGSLTGTAVMNILATGVLTVIFPLLVTISGSYCDIFIQGYYKMPEWISDISRNFNPAMNLLFRYKEDSPSDTIFIIYFAVGILFSLIGRKIYKTRKLERIGNSTLSKCFEELMTYLVVFIGMSAFGLMMYTFSTSKAIIIFGMLVGTLVTFFIVKIIVNRSVRIFSKDSIRSLAVYFAIAALFIALTVFDVTGFTKRVPEVDEVESVNMNDVVLGYGTLQTYGIVSKDNKSDERAFTSPESIEKIAELHQYIVDNELYNENYQSDGAVIYDIDGQPTVIENEYIHIKYKLKNGRTIERQYDLVMDQHVAEMLDELLTSDEYREKNSILSYINIEEINYIQLTGLTTEYYDYYYGDAEDEAEDVAEDAAEDTAGIYEERDINNMAVIDNPKLIKKIFTAWDKDMRSFGYVYNNENVSVYNDVVNIEIFFKDSNKSSKKKHDNRSDSVTLVAKDIYTNVISCLKDNGYGYIVGYEEGKAQE